MIFLEFIRIVDEVDNAKYLDNYDGIGESRDPREIVGAKGVLLYNIKYVKNNEENMWK